MKSTICKPPAQAGVSGALVALVPVASYQTVTWPLFRNPVGFWIRRCEKLAPVLLVGASRIPAHGYEFGLP